jgi:hypothetical protein
MSHDSTSMTTNLDRRNPSYSSGAVGVIIFAAVLMIMIGGFHAIQGLVALLNDEFFVVGSEYVFEFDITAWGWIHLILGVFVAVAGAALLSGPVWARTVAVIVAAISMVASFVWLPYYPLWSILVIALDVFVIWAVILHGRDMVDE